MQKNQSENRKKDPESSLKFFTDFLPLIVFFAVYKFSNHAQPIIPATIWLVVVTVIALVIAYILTKKIAMMPLFSAIILSIFGGLTIFSGNEVFIKMKPTLLNFLFSAILITGYLMKKPLLKYLLAGAFEISDRAWMVLSLRWAFLFVGLAILNEFIWRNFSTDFWVQFKVFGILPISIIFAMLNFPYIIKESKKAK